jgi:hypothetical protein
MLYNATHKLTVSIAEPSQEDIYNCPYYFGMSYDQVKQSGCPEFLVKLLDQFPFDGRKNVLQIRPQDFRTQRPNIDGAFWHCDDNVRLINDTPCADSIDDFHLMVISWGGMCGTEFIETHMDLPNHLQDPQGAHNLMNHYIAQGIETKIMPSGVMVEYTSRDLHRAALINDVGKLRLMIVAFDNNKIDGNIRILPTIREQCGGIPYK